MSLFLNKCLFGHFFAASVKRPIDLSFYFYFVFSAMDGVPFMISEKFACASSDVSCPSNASSLLAAG